MKSWKPSATGQPDFYLPTEDPDMDNGKIWLGAADDTILRKRGVEFVDGSAPGFAAIVGAAPNSETAKMIVEEYQRRNLYIFCAANHNGTTVIEQLMEAGVQIGWNTRIVPFGPDISSAVFALGFANRAAMAFGGVSPVTYKKILHYNKDRVFAFVNALGDIGTEWAANAAGCVNWGFPTLADTDIPEILPTGICTYEHVVANVTHDEMVQKSVEIRGLKTMVSEGRHPLRLRPAFEGERVRGADLFVPSGRRQDPGHRAGGNGRDERDRRRQGHHRQRHQGPGRSRRRNLALGHLRPGGRPQMQPDFEPILERQIHH
jgi:acetyl-CoA synthase